MQLRKTLLSQSRTVKKSMLLTHDFFIVFIVFWITIDFNSALLTELLDPSNWTVVLMTSLLSVGVFLQLNLYKSVMRFSGVSMPKLLVYGSLASTFILSTLYLLIKGNLSWTLPFFNFFVLVSLLTGSRVTIREWLNNEQVKSGLPVLVYGAGLSGRQLVEAIKQLDEYKPIAFIDDNIELSGSTIHDLKVYPPRKIEYLKSKFGVEKILLAIPSIDKDDKKNVLKSLEKYELEVMSIPSMKDLVEGKLSISHLKKVSILDLLGRTPISPSPKLMGANILSKNVMVTGAGGSIGSELCRQIVTSQPKCIVLFEISEFALYSIHKEIMTLCAEKQLECAIYPILGSVQDRKKLYEVMQTFGVQTIYHAAAYKHVPMVEYNMFSGIENNILGTYVCATAAIKANVEHFVLISTDKAVRPTNTMGATKRFAELALQALAKDTSHNTEFCMVRFGNVLGSSGSVVPVFEKQIAEGGPVTVTHKDIIRYFMTIPEAAQLVIQAGAMGTDGNVYVLDMGEPVKIYDLATQMIHLSGHKLKDENHPEGDIEIKITGLRPGEKLYEELLVGHNVYKTDHPRIMAAQELSMTLNEFNAALKRLLTAIQKRDYQEARQTLLDAPTAFKPKDDICDYLFLSRDDKHIQPTVNNP